MQTGADGRLNVADPSMRKAVLDLRLDPQASALMAGELTQDHAAYLQGRTGRQPTQPIADLSNPILQPWAREEVRTHNELALAGKKSAFRDIVILNSAAALQVAGKARDLKDGAAMAIQSIDSGKAAATLAALRRICA